MITDKRFFHRSFRGESGDVEHFLSIVAPGDMSFAEQLAFVHARYIEASHALALNPQSAIFRRIFLSDAVNQAAALYASTLFAENGDNPVSVSVVQQQPLPESKIALLAYHIESKAPIKKKRLSPKHVLVEKNGARTLWSTQLCRAAHAASTPVEAQTREIFGALIETLKSFGGTLKDNCVRTWIYVQDIDALYPGMVAARQELFTHEGLTEDTHYIASTSNEGASDHPLDLILVDAYSHLDLKPAQISYLNDFDYLCPPKKYRVAFERGARIAYADRAHHFISGTPSIDKFGNILHRDDVIRQLERALVNIEALLKSGQASFADLMYFIVYLRDRTDYKRVDAYLRARFPDLPMVIVEGAICRPEWLIELEAMAVAPHDAPHLPSF